MSLVNEALKRVRTQSAFQHAADNPLSHISAPSHYSERKRSYVPIILIGLFACCFVGLVSAAVLHLRKPVNEITPSAMPIASAPQPAVQHRVSMPTPPVPSPTSDAAVAPSPAPTEPVAIVETKPAVTIDPAPQSEKAETPPPAPAAPSLMEGKVYLQAIDFPDVPKLRLDGILWSDKAPLALVNGMSAAPGDDIGGVSVIAIEPKRVTFEALGKRFYIRLP